jgi:hypothetical protein
VRLLSLSQAVALSSCNCSVYDLGSRERIEGIDSVGDCVMFRAFVRKCVGLVQMECTIEFCFVGEF